METYDVKGMSCAACVARVESAVNGVEGVTSCAVNLLTNSMNVEGTAKAEVIIKAVQDAGYDAAIRQDDNYDSVLEDTETPKLIKRLVTSVVLVLILMYFSMGHMLHLPMPMGIVNHIIQFVLAAAVMFVNRKFFISGFKTIFHMAPNMDTLVAMGSGVAFVYSVVIMITGRGHLYFETAAMIPTFITIGKTLEAKSKGKTTDALKSLIRLSPKKAIVVRGEAEQEVDITEVKLGDIIAVYPGAAIPVDGEIISGDTSINESMLTGESIPVDKTIGDMIHAGTINNNGYIRAKATKVGGDTALAQIIKLVNDAASTKAPIAKLADRVAGVFVPVVLGIALVTTIIWLLVGASIETAINYGIAVLVISCPCSLGLATPVAIMVGNGVGAKNNILFKSAESLEMVGKIDVIALDKTGTITSGEPSVTDVIPVNSDENDLIRLAYSLENKSEHPLAKAVVKYAENKSVQPLEVANFKASAGNGITGVIDGTKLVAGSYTYVCNIVTSAKACENDVIKLANSGKTPVLVANEKEVLGIIGIADKVKPDSVEAISEIKDLGIEVVMLTGDNANTAAAIGESVGIANVVSSVKPDGKDRVIKELQKIGKVSMVGDGINDAPALTRADIGIAIGAGTDVAIDAADVVLMKSSLKDVAAAIRLSRSTMRTIKQNLFWAFFYNSIGVPVAAGVFASSLGWKLNPMIGAACMSISSVCVVLNALRLNLADISKGWKNTNRNSDVSIVDIVNEINIKNKEVSTMTKTIVIEGMMCKHCEARVKDALEALENVSEAAVSHETGTAVVTLTADVADEVLKSTVEAERYTVIEVK